jgi:ribosomal protein L29
LKSKRCQLYYKTRQFTKTGSGQTEGRAGSAYVFALADCQLKLRHLLLNPAPIQIQTLNLESAARVCQTRRQISAIKTQRREKQRYSATQCSEIQRNESEVDGYRWCSSSSELVSKLSLLPRRSRRWFGSSASACTRSALSFAVFPMFVPSLSW